MDLATVILIAFGLCMDTFAVSIASGMASRESKVRDALILATSFAAFQMGMPVLGWLGASSLRDLISGVDHWIAFALLAAIGGKMLYEARRGEEEEDRPLTPRLLITLSLATSIDAFAIGVTFAFLEVSIVMPIIVIGIVTLLVSLTGSLIGNKAGSLLGTSAEVLGGLILIGIGIRILVEHLA